MICNISVFFFSFVGRSYGGYGGYYHSGPHYHYHSSPVVYSGYGGYGYGGYGYGGWGYSDG